MNNKDKHKVVAPGEFLGIIGGGQLGWMLAMAAKKLGIKTAIFSQIEDCPAQAVSDVFFCGPYEDAQLLDQFSRQVQVATYEFENIPLSVIDYIQSRVALHPGRDVLAVSQDRLAEKSFFHAIGIKCAPFGAISYEGDIKKFMQSGNHKQTLLKTRKMGYDGKGQAFVDNPDNAIEAYYKLNQSGIIIEDVVDYTQEFSVIGVRTLEGDFHHYDVVDNYHTDGVLQKSVVPSSISDAHKKLACEYTQKIADNLNYVGVIVVEYFLTKQGDILVNEFAPRVHNSGHWTIDACGFDQFTQHIRAICGWSLGDFGRHCDAKMTNLIGDDVNNWQEIIKDNRTILHLYGKSEVRQGRKMGHATQLK